MSRTRKVIDFPSGKQGDGSLKLFAMLFYLIVAFLLIFVADLSEGGLGILLALGLLYNYGVKQRIYKTSYFRNNRVLISILMVIFTVLYWKTMIILAVVVGAYWLLVGRTGREAPYFLKFHILTALIFNFLLLMPYLILTACISLIGRCLLLINMKAPAQVVGLMASEHLPLLMMGLLAGAAIWLAGSVLMGRTPYIGIVTDNVRHLA